MGGMTGQQLAVRYRTWSRSIVMANAASYFDDAIRTRLMARIRQAQEQGMAAVADEAMHRWFTPGFFWPARTARPELRRCARAWWRWTRRSMRPAAKP